MMNKTNPAYRPLLWSTSPCLQSFPRPGSVSSIAVHLKYIAQCPGLYVQWSCSLGLCSSVLSCLASLSLKLHT